MCDQFSFSGRQDRETIYEFHGGKMQVSAETSGLRLQLEAASGSTHTETGDRLGRRTPGKSQSGMCKTALCAENGKSDSEYSGITEMVKGGCGR